MARGALDSAQLSVLAALRISTIHSSRRAQKATSSYLRLGGGSPKACRGGNGQAFRTDGNLLG